MLENLRSAFSSTEISATSSASPTASSGFENDTASISPVDGTTEKEAPSTSFVASSGSDGDMSVVSPDGGTAEDTESNITFGSFGDSPASVPLPAGATKEAKN
ncbi:unnamed protein product, partial [Ectocarpus sp. 6 AP-2014]